MTEEPQTIVQRIDERIETDTSIDDAAPEAASAEEFLTMHARVRQNDNSYAPYSFEGRAPLLFATRMFDELLGKRGATLAICGGAQFGKTVWYMLLFLYLTALRWRNVALYVKGDKEVNNIVDLKFRPEVATKHPWYRGMMAIGKTIEKGLAVSRKAAWTVTDGFKTALGMVMGLGSEVTTYSVDVAVVDERDDVPHDKAKGIRSRLTTSDEALEVSIGTQRWDAIGQNKQFLDGTQHVIYATTSRGDKVNLEESWPGCLRLQVGERKTRSDPRLTRRGDFARAGDGGERFTWTPDDEGRLYFAHPETGAVLSRKLRNLLCEPRRPDRIPLRRYSMRISQLACEALRLGTIVSWYCEALLDPDVMEDFGSDVLGIPVPQLQELNESHIKESRERDPFPLYLGKAAAPVYVGVDTGKVCHIVTKEVEGPTRKLARWFETPALADVVRRCGLVMAKTGAECIFVDDAPNPDHARLIALAANGLATYQQWPKFKTRSDAESAHLSLGAMTWDGDAKMWRGLRGAVVEFVANKHSGITHKLGIADDDGQRTYYPVIQCNRDWLIGTVVREFLTVRDGVFIAAEGEEPRDFPATLLPSTGGRSHDRDLCDALGRHLLAGSRRKLDPVTNEPASYVKGIDNHGLLALCYATLGESVVGGLGNKPGGTGARGVSISGGKRKSRTGGLIPCGL